MKTLLQIAAATAALLIVASPLAPWCVAAGNLAQQSQPPALDQTPLTAEQVRDLVSLTIENQHRNDAALDSFERIERQVSHAGSASGPVIEEKTYRVVPTGSGTLKLLLRANGQPVSEALYRRQLRDWENILKVAVNADDPRQIAVLAKQQKKMKARAHFIDAARTAFQITWAGREIRDGRAVEKLQFTPNPSYPTHGDATDWLSHARATVWIDPQADQVVSIDATIIRDISIGAGFLGKIYRGGHFTMQQAPVAPGIWEPTLYEYDISGRKFLFSFSMHEAISDEHYQLLGLPEQLLDEARDNLAHCCDMAAALNP